MQHQFEEQKEAKANREEEMKHRITEELNSKIDTSMRELHDAFSGKDVLLVNSLVRRQA